MTVHDWSDPVEEPSTRLRLERAGSDWSLQPQSVRSDLKLKGVLECSGPAFDPLNLSFVVVEDVGDLVGHGKGRARPTVESVGIGLPGSTPYSRLRPRLSRAPP